MFTDLPRLVEVEVAEPEPGEGQHHPALELQNRGVDPIRLPPPIETQDPPGDDEVHDPDHLPEVEERDLTPPPRPPQRPPDEPPSELLRFHVRYVRPKDGSSQYPTPAGQRAHVLRDDRYLGEFRHSNSSDQSLQIHGDPVLVHRRRHGVGGLADLVGHPPDRDPVSDKAEHVHVVVRVPEGDRTPWVYPPELAQELECSGLRALEAPDLDVVRQAAGDEEPPRERRPRLLDPALYVVGVIHKHELGRLPPAIPQPVGGRIDDGEAWLFRATQML